MKKTASRKVSAANRRSLEPVGSASFFWPLFMHMDQEHGLILLEGEMAEIVRVVEAMRVDWSRDNGRLRESLRWIAERDQQGDIRAVAREAIGEPNVAREPARKKESDGT